MHFGVIYEVEVPNGVSLKNYMPTQRKLFHTTEGDENAEYRYLGDDWSKSKHRKVCATLTRKQFERFLDDTGLFPEDVETGGILGAPWSESGLGWAPAISFRSDDPEAIQSASVTPLMSVENRWEGRSEESERNVWDRVRRAVINTYKDR